MSDSGNNEQWEAACSVDALKEGRLIEHMSKSMLLVLAWVDDAPWAATGLCPHQFARLAEGRIEGGRLHCARHLASFCRAQRGARQSLADLKDQDLQDKDQRRDCRGRHG